MASRISIFSRFPETCPRKACLCFFCIRRTPAYDPEVIIAKGNIIEGIEAKE